MQETAEHIVKVESFLGPAVQQTLVKDPDPSVVENPPFEVMKLRVLDRSHRGVRAPEPMIPHGQWSPAETAQRYREAHAVIREMLTRPDLALKAHVFTGGPGTFTLDHWLTLVSLHTRRHLGQIVKRS